MARELLFRLALPHAEIAIVWADSAYAKNGLVPWAKKYLGITIKTVRRPTDAKGCDALPRRWAVERSWSWIMKARRHCHDHERLPEMSEALITWAAITTSIRTEPSARCAHAPEPRCLQPPGTGSSPKSPTGGFADLERRQCPSAPPRPHIRHRHSLGGGDFDRVVRA